MAEVTPLAQQTPKTYSSIGHNAKVAAIVDAQTNLNAWMTHWASITTPVVIMAQNASPPDLHLVRRINDTINTMNAVCTEFTLLTGAGARMKNYISVDRSSFASVMNAINGQLQAMATAKP